ncbi:MAG: NRAMP family divalent metal transporter [Veillonella sp.]|nr:NRAMP family divalent metal transporter [Veillonella sp.]
MKPITGKASLSVLLGAAFLMATSSIGPGFMLQTAAFTGQLQADFAFAIVVSVIFSIIAQLNVWTIIGISQMRGQDIANKVLPGLGYFVAFLISLGGLAFNIGNIGGASMGLNIVFGIDTTTAAAISGILGILLFASPKMGGVLEFSTNPPVAEAATHALVPTNYPWLATITLIGGTVGGYITFSGGHRLIDAGITGREHLKDVRRAAFMGMSVDAIVRILLFLAVLGVVSMGFALDPKDPAGSAFLLGAGEIGHKLFGIVFFCAALTSVVGAAYTSVSFLKTLFKVVERYEKLTIMAFIFVSTCILIFIGKPATLLIVAGSVNGLILPVTLAVMLLATRKTNIVGDYKHNPVLFYTGWIVVLVTAYIGVTSLQGIAKLLG